MKKILYWLDDEMDDGKRLPSSAVQARLAEALGVKVSPQPLKSRQAFNQLIESLDAVKDWAVILDYKLTGLEPIGDSQTGGNGLGTTYAADIRAIRPSIPVIGVSNEDAQGIPKFRMENYLAFFSRSSLTGLKAPFGAVKALVDGYHSVWQSFEKRAGKLGVDVMLSLIRPPKPVRDMMALAIPNELRGSWDSETPHSASRWLWHELQGKPGFLFDSLGLATCLGLNLKGLELVKDSFKASLYEGAMRCGDRPRWWAASIRGICEEILGKRVIGPLSKSRLDLLKALGISLRKSKLLLAVVYPGKDGIPDCVAYKSGEMDEEDRVQTLLVNTAVVESESNPPFGFEGRRYYHPSNVS